MISETPAGSSGLGPAQHPACPQIGLGEPNVLWALPHDRRVEERMGNGMVLQRWALPSQDVCHLSMGEYRWPRVWTSAGASRGLL